jgi:hypothetical protein
MINPKFVVEYYDDLLTFRLSTAGAGGSPGLAGPEAEDGPDGAVSLAERDPLQLPARKFWIERNSVPE